MKKRLDLVLLERGLAPTRNKAQALIWEGSVLVDGQKRTKAGDLVDTDAAITLREKLPYVGRGGYKLAHAFATWPLDVAGRTVIDVGASTGGFTDVLLKHSAGRVFAIDVGYGQLDYRLRNDPRVVPLERTNIRQLQALPDGVLADCGVVDVSFISLKLVLPAMQRLLTPTAWVVALIKPQFEAGPQDVGRGGVVRDANVHRRVLEDVLEFAAASTLCPHGLIESPVRGPAGNREFLAWLGGPGPPLDIDRAIADVLAAADD